jgi:hypothetical protein
MLDAAVSRTRLVWGVAAIGCGPTRHEGDPDECAALELPGEPDDLAATPRADEDAEILALELDPSRIVAREVDYGIIAEDLAAIRTLAPDLAEIHIACRGMRGFALWWFGYSPVITEIDNGTFRAWDCHNAHYGIDPGDITRIDGIAFAIEFDEVYSSEVTEVYAGVPGLEDVDFSPWFDSCDETAGTITLQAVLGEDGAPTERTYRFGHPEMGEIAYHARDRGAPELLE